MRSQSAKARRQNVQRQSLRNTLPEARGGACEACALSPVGEYPPRRFTDLHEVLLRSRGGDPTDPANILLLCSPCHEFITTHEVWARENGFVRVRTADEHEEIFKPWLNT